MISLASLNHSSWEISTAFSKLFVSSAKRVAVFSPIPCLIKRSINVFLTNGWKCKVWHRDWIVGKIRESEVVSKIAKICPSGSSKNFKRLLAAPVLILSASWIKKTFLAVSTPLLENSAFNSRIWFTLMVCPSGAILKTSGCSFSLIRTQLWHSLQGCWFTKFVQKTCFAIHKPNSCFPVPVSPSKR